MESQSSRSISAFLILLALISFSSNGEARRVAGSTNTEFIRTSCSATAYPALCYSSLSSHATVIQQNHKLLANTALDVSLTTALSTSTDMVKLSHASGMAPREAAAMRDCIEELTDSVDQIRKSMDEMEHMKASEFEMVMSDVQTWVSAALTDEDTCMDGFAGKFMNGGLKTAVRGKIVNVAHMTSNALALINNYASLHA